MRFIVALFALTLIWSAYCAPDNAGNFSKRTPPREERQLEIGCEYDYPPFCVVPKGGGAEGFSIDLVKEVLKVMRLKVGNIRSGPWSELKDALKKGEIDILPLVSYSPERDKYFDFTVPYLQMHGAIFVRDDDTCIKDENDLKDKKVIVMRGGTAHEYAVKKRLSNHLIIVDTYEEAMKLLSKGGHDAVLAQNLMGLQLLDQLGIKNVRVLELAPRALNTKVEADETVAFEQKLCFAVRHGDSELLSKLNEGLAIVKASGEYDRLYRKWIYPITPHFEDYKASFIRIGAIAGLGIVVLIVIGVVWQCSLRRALNHRTRELDNAMKELRLLNENLETRVSERTAAIQDEIEERKKIEQDMITAKEDAILANNAKSQFLANISHELRTPLHAIMGMNGLLLETKLDDGQKELVGNVEKAGGALLKIVNSILDLTKVERDQMEVERERISISDLFKYLCLVYQNSTIPSKAQLSFMVEKEVPDLIEADNRKLNQVLMNLVDNALKFTSRGTIEVKVRPFHDEMKNTESLLFEVIDTGIGIPEEKCDEIFAPFTQVDSGLDKSYEGTGLGLTICQRFVRLMGGELKVESCVGKGSRFYFTLPYRKAKLDTGSELNQMDNRDDSSAWGRKRVLVVEDNQMNMKVVGLILESLGCVYDAATNGREALEFCGERRYDLIFMDIQMAGLDGMETTKMIREQTGNLNCETPIVALTAHAVKGFKEECLRAGIDQVITKPFRKKELIAVCERYLSL